MIRRRGSAQETISKTQPKDVSDANAGIGDVFELQPVDIHDPAALEAAAGRERLSKLVSGVISTESECPKVLGTWRTVSESSTQPCIRFPVPEVNWWTPMNGRPSLPDRQKRTGDEPESGLGNDSVNSGCINII